MTESGGGRAASEKMREKARQPGKTWRPAVLRLWVVTPWGSNDLFTWITQDHWKAQIFML